MDPITKTKIRTAVADYQKMFPDEYEELMTEITLQRENLASDTAEIRGTHHIHRALFTVSENLSQMIAKKLTDEEALSFKELDNARWFAKEFSQFALSRNI